MSRFITKRRLIGVLLSLTALAVIAYFSIGWVLYNQLTAITPYCPRYATHTPAQFRVPWEKWKNFDTTPYRIQNYEAVHFLSRQTDISLSGWYVAGDPQAPAVIVVHGINACKGDPYVLITASMLAQHGFSVLIMDMRNHGDSEVDTGHMGVGNKEYLDVLGAWDWLQTAQGFPAERIGVVGQSLGGGTTLIAFGQEPRLAAIWVDSPYSDLQQIITEELVRNNYPTFLMPSGIWVARLARGEDLLAHSPQEAVRNNVGRPMFIVHGDGDKRINVHHTLDLQTLAQQTNANLTTWVVPGADHIETMLLYPPEYEQRLTDFFTQALDK